MKKYILKEIGITIIASTYIIILIILFNWILGKDITMINGSVFIIGILTSLLISISIKNILYNDNKKEVEDYYKYLRGSVRLSKSSFITNETLQTKKEEIKDTSDIIELMLLNMKEIKEYYVMSKDMAKKSFALSVTMCILGFGIILFSIIDMFLTDITLIESLIPVIGGSVVEVIAGTSLIVYKKSLEQLNQYYEALHNNERYLSLVNLVDKLSDDKKDEMYIGIINSQLEKLK